MGKKLVIVGLDACDKDLVLQWADEGHLPNFKALSGASSWGEIENAHSLEAGSAWPCFFYGSFPSAHGQYDGYRFFVPEDYSFRGYTQEELPRETIWTILANAGRKSFLIDAPYIPTPVHENCTAIMNWGTHTPSPGTSSIGVVSNPPELAEEVIERFGEDPLENKMCDYYRPRTVDDMAWFRDRLIERARVRTAMTKHYMATAEWDFFLSVFSEAHCIGHHAWHLHDPSHAEHDPAVAAALGDPILDVYKAIDASIGEIKAACGDEVTFLVYLSHGMEKGYSGTRLLDRILTRLESGGQDAAGYGAKQVLRDIWATVWRASPRPVKKLLEPLRKSVRGAVYNDGFQPNREGRRFFEVYANDRTAGIRLNVKGRERDGMIERGAEYEAVCDQLERDLKEIVNAETGEPLVAEVTRLRDEFDGECVDRLPDLTVTWNRHKPIRRVRSAKIGEVEHRHPNIRSGDHQPVGMFFCAGPQVQAGRLNDRISVRDLATTAAGLFQVEDDQLEGQRIASVR